MDFKQLFKQYDQFQEHSINKRLFKPEAIHELILKLADHSTFSVNEIGRSIEERPIYSVAWGKGTTHILLWSQMHGDEPTATMAFLDIFNWLASSNEYDQVKQHFAEKLALHFIPVVNPDGAAKYQRRNAIDIDLNRDALRLQSPESKALFSYCKQIKPAWAFNMHDQHNYYTVGESFETATISFLAPSYNLSRSINEVRADAMKVIVSMNDLLQQFIPGKIAKYTDKFYPKSFGDNFQKLGVRTILVESGGYKGDPEKQYIRKLHFCLLIKGLHSICTQSFENSDLSSYDAIPENSELLFDLIIRNATLSKTSGDFSIDLAYKTKAIVHENLLEFYHLSNLEDLGDLSFHKAYTEFDAAGMEIELGCVYPHILESADSRSTTEYRKMLEEGYTEIRVKKMPEKMNAHNFPVRFIPESAKTQNNLKVGSNPSLFLKKNGKRIIAVVNGFLYQL